MMKISQHQKSSDVAWNETVQDVQSFKKITKLHTSYAISMKLNNDSRLLQFKVFMPSRNLI